MDRRSRGNNWAGTRFRFGNMHIFRYFICTLTGSVFAQFYVLYLNWRMYSTALDIIVLNLHFTGTSLYNVHSTFTWSRQRSSNPDQVESSVGLPPSWLGDRYLKQVTFTISNGKYISDYSCTKSTMVSTTVTIVFLIILNSVTQGL